MLHPQWVVTLGKRFIFAKDKQNGKARKAVHYYVDHNNLKLKKSRKSNICPPVMTAANI